MQEVIPWRRIESATPIFASVAVSIIRTPCFCPVTDSTSVLERRMSAGSIPSANLIASGRSSPVPSRSIRRPRSGSR